MFMFHNESHGIAGLSAAEAFVDTLNRRYSEGRGFFIMERTETEKVHSSAAKANKVPDHLFDFSGRYDIINGFAGNHKTVEAYSESTKFRSLNQ